MKKLLLGMGYLTWFICNLAVIYGIGLGAWKLIESESFGQFIGHLALGMVMLLLLVILSFLCLALVITLFGDEKLNEKLDKSLPDFMKG